MYALRYDLKRKYWLATAMLLTAGLVGWPPGVAAAIGLTLVQLLHFGYREQSLGTLTVQVRAAYLAMLLLGLWPPLAFLHVAQAIGVWVNVLYDYCVAARILSLLPWNRRHPLSLRLVAWTFLTPPGAASILERARRSDAAPAVRCAAGDAAPGSRRPAR